jgi:hypothetical protein
MAHFAKIVDGIVEQVIVAETKQWCEEYLGGTWEQTSYNTLAGEHTLGGTPFRYNYAGIGYTFDPNYGEEGAFIAPQPYPSWKLSSVNATWLSPKPRPESGAFVWNESNQEWEELISPTE